MYHVLVFYVYMRENLCSTSFKYNLINLFLLDGEV